tara:strand:- start:459 stop:578 length:120 start_codon:yes stop_codon:yes gene_type:complete
MTALGYFILGFIVVFFGGLIYLGKWELFDVYDENDDEEY